MSELKENQDTTGETKEEKEGAREEQAPGDPPESSPIEDDVQIDVLDVTASKLAEAEKKDLDLKIESKITSAKTISKLAKAVKKAINIGRQFGQEDPLLSNIAGNLLVFDNIENDKEATLYVKHGTTISTLQATLKEIFQYERPAIIGTAANDPNSSAFNDQIEILESFKEIPDEAALAELLLAWNKGAGLRRQRKVLGAARAVRADLAGGTRREEDGGSLVGRRLRGLAGAFELFSNPANLFAVDNFVVQHLCELMPARIDLPPEPDAAAAREDEGSAGGAAQGRAPQAAPAAAAAAAAAQDPPRRLGSDGDEGKGDPRVAAKAALVCWLLARQSEFVRRLAAQGMDTAALANLAALAEARRRRRGGGGGGGEQLGMRELQCHCLGLLCAMLALREVRARAAKECFWGAKGLLWWT